MSTFSKQHSKPKLKITRVAFTDYDVYIAEYFEISCDKGVFSSHEIKLNTLVETIAVTEMMW